MKCKDLESISLGQVPVCQPKSPSITASLGLMERAILIRIPKTLNNSEEMEEDTRVNCEGITRPTGSGQSGDTIVIVRPNILHTDHT